MHRPVGWRIVSAAVWHDRRTRRHDGDQRARRTTRRPVDPGRRRSAGRARTYEIQPDPADPAQRVAFGTSGHRGSSLNGAFNEAHILATTEAICRYRERQGTDGPLFIGQDTHALSEPALRTALEVLVAHGVDVRVDAADGYTPTPAVSHAILVHNRGRPRPPGRRHRGHARRTTRPRTAASSTTRPTAARPTPTSRGWIQDEANRPARGRGLDGVRRVPIEQARARTTAARLRGDLRRRPRLGHRHGRRSAAPGCGSASTRWAAPSVAYWPAIAERYGLDLTVTNEVVDPQFGFMTCDWDGRIRMDPSSPYAMARLVELRDRFDVAFGNDTDADRHGIVTPGAGLMNPNHFLSAAVAYLFGGGRDWGARRRPSARRSSRAR